MLKALLTFAALLGGAPLPEINRPQPYQLPPQVRDPYIRDAVAGFNAIQTDLGVPQQQTDGTWRLVGGLLESDPAAIRDKYDDQYWQRHNSDTFQMFKTKFSKDGKTLHLTLPIVDRKELREQGVKNLPETVFYYPHPEHRWDTTWKLDVKL